jgi:hypothetical protein
MTLTLFISQFVWCALLKSKVKNLERELRRKEKALAETAALLVLQKKVNELWPQEEDD